MSNVLAVLVFAMVLGALGVYVELQGVEWPKRRRPHYVRNLSPPGPAPTPYSPTPYSPAPYSEPGDRTSPPDGSGLPDPWPLPKRSVRPQPLPSEDAGGSGPPEPGPPVDAVDPEFEWFDEAEPADPPPSDDHLDEQPPDSASAGWFGEPVQRTPTHDSFDPDLASSDRDHGEVHRVELR